MLTQAMKTAIPQLQGTTKVRGCHFNDSRGTLEVSCGDQCFDLVFRYDDTGSSTRTVLTLRRDRHREEVDQFVKDPVHFLERRKARFGPERYVDVVFELRAWSPEGIIGCALVVATAPSSLYELALQASAQEHEVSH